MMKTAGKVFLALMLFFGVLRPAWAEDSPEQVYQKWVEAVQKGNLKGVLDVSSKQIRDQAKVELKTDEDRETTVAFLRTSMPKNVKVLSKDISPDLAKATLVLEATKANPLAVKSSAEQLSKGEVHFVKEDGNWKIEDQSWAQEDVSKEKPAEPRK